MTAARLALVGLVLALLASCRGDPPTDAEGNVVTIGKFRIRTFPKGAEVWVDGKKEVVSTPATLILEAGEHHLRIQHPGAAEGIEETVTVEAAREKTLDVRIPAPPRSTLAVRSNVEGASVRVNGYRRGVTPLAPVTVKAGAVDVTVTAPDGRARAARTHLAWGEDEVLQVDFGDDALSGAETTGAPGRVTIVLAPSGWIETSTGARLGEAPLRDHPFAAGRHRLRLRTRDGRARDVEIQVGSGERAVYRFRLRPDERLPDAGTRPD